MKLRIIFLMLVILILISSGCTEQQDEFTISDNATIMSMTYRTTSLTDMEVQELTINATSMNLSIYNSMDQLEARYITPMNEYQWKQPPYILKGKTFLEMSSTSKAQKIRPDIPSSGTLEITVLQDGEIHTVTFDHASSEYPQAEMYELEDFMTSRIKAAYEPSFEEAREIVEEWIISMPTYSFDGSNLTLDEHIREDTLPSTHLLIYTFTSSHKGYGDRSDEELTEAPTNHTIWVTFSQREIRKAIIDESWDEIAQEAV